MDAVRPFLGFAEDSDARVAERCVGAVSSSAGGQTWQDCRRDAAAAQGGGGSERKDGRQRPNDESRTTAPRAARLFLVLKPLGCLRRRRITTTRMPSGQFDCKATAQTENCGLQRTPWKSASQPETGILFDISRTRCRATVTHPRFTTGLYYAL